MAQQAMTAPTTVHLVDDDQSVLRGLSWFLESAGIGVRTYASGDEFLKRHESGPNPECIVLDLRMPGLSGIDVQQKLVEQGVATPVIFLTAHGRVPDAVAAMKKGAFEFLEKPFADDAMLARLGPNWRVGKVVGAGHFIQLVAPAQVNAMVDRYLELIGRA